MSLLADSSITAAPAHQAPAWTLRVESAVSGRPVKIGGKFSSEDEAAEVASLYRLNGTDGYPAAGSIEVGLLQQLCAAAAVAVSDDDLRDVGSVRIHPDVAAWFSAVLDEDGMTDTFATCHPSARDRFTCWDQSTNRRYVNEGSRIDYILIDRALMPYLQKGGQLPGACGVSAHVSAPASILRTAAAFPQRSVVLSTSVDVTQPTGCGGGVSQSCSARCSGSGFLRNRRRTAVLRASAAWRGRAARRACSRRGDYVLRGAHWHSVHAASLQRSCGSQLLVTG